MNKETLEKGNQLLEWIKDLKNQKSKWERSTSIHVLELADREDEYRSRSTHRVDNTWVNFDDMKLLAISRISKRIEELQREFDNL